MNYETWLEGHELLLKLQMLSTLDAGKEVISDETSFAYDELCRWFMSHAGEVIDAIQTQ